MKTVTLEQKMSGTGTIHDIESEHYQRVIRFPEGQEYAVVLASYYGGKGYHTTSTADKAIALSLKRKDFSHTIIDSEGVALSHYDLECRANRGG